MDMGNKHPDPKAAALTVAPLFDGFSRTELARFASCLDLAEVAAGEALVEQGRRAGALWLIAGGEVELHSDGHRLGRVGPGQVLGAAAMFARGQAELTGIALGSVRALVASPRQFNELRADPRLELRLRRLIS